jgi:hypothetical protein
MNLAKLSVTGFKTVHFVRNEFHYGLERLLELTIRDILLKTNDNDIDDLNVQFYQVCNGTYLYVTELPKEYEFI